MASLASKVASYIHFSEPDKGPLSDFHTFAPDMMKLFAKGITDNAGLIDEAFNNSLSIGIAHTAASAGGFAGTAGAAAREIVFNVTELIDGDILARNQYRFNLDEANRHGKNLINAYA